jgi:hypothetical protein
MSARRSWRIVSLRSAILASRSQSVDCTLEAVEGARSLAPRHTYLEGLSVRHDTHKHTHPDNRNHALKDACSHPSHVCGA